MTTIVVQGTEVILRAWPFQIHSAAWRISFVSNTTSIVLTLLLMTFVLLAIAIFAGHRRLTLTFTGFAVLAATALFIMSGLFVLDALEMRNQIQVAVWRQYDVTTLWALIRVLMGIAGFVLLAMAGLRGARAMGRPAARKPKKGGTLVVESSEPGVKGPTA